MLKQLILTILAAGMLVMNVTGSALAKISEPDVVYYGTALNAPAGGVVSIRLGGASRPLTSFTLGSDLSYLLRVPMDALDPRLPDTARSGDIAVISVDGVTAATVTIPPRGSIVRLELTKRDLAQWEALHPGDDGSGDMNRNGRSDLEEFLAGLDPAACVWKGVDATHAETTVYHPQVLKNCLTDSATDLKHDLIRLARGTYSGNFGYVTASGEDFNLTITGGYDPAGTGERLYDPSLTTLSGDTDNDGTGNGTVFSVDTSSGNSSGTVRIEGVSLRGGKAPDTQVGGGALYARLHRGALEVVGNIISANSAKSGAGVYIDSSDSGGIILANNVIHGNSAGHASAVRVASISGPLTLLNNTVADNTATSDGDGRSLLIESSAAVEVINNIIRGSSSVAGAEIALNTMGTPTLPAVFNNDFDVAAGLYANASGFALDPSNIDTDPQFSAAPSGRYALAATSPCIDKGAPHAKSTEKDVRGVARVIGSSVDIGAYEVSPGAVVFDPASLSRTYDGSAKPAAVTTTPAGLPLTVTYNGSTDVPTAAGSYTVVATISHPEYQGSAAGTLKIAKATATVTFDNLVQTYDGMAKAVTAMTSPPGKTVTFTYNGSESAPLNAGSYAVVATVSDANYQGNASDTLFIAKAPQTVRFPATGGKTYGDADFGAGATADTGLPVTCTSDTPSVATVTGDVVHIVGAGTARIRATQAGTANYLPASAEQTLTVAKAVVTVTADNKSRAYGAPDPSFSATYSGFVNGEIAAVVSGAPSFTTGATAISPQGSYPITTDVTHLSAANYTFAAVNGTLAVELASQSISLTPLPQKVYGDLPFDLAASGGASGNPVTFTSSDTSVATVSGSTVTIVGPGQTTITAFLGGVAGKYASATAEQPLIVVAAQTPTLILSTVPDGAYTGAATLNLAGSASDDSGIAGLTVNGAAVTVNADGSFSHVMELADGANTIATVLTDTAGNVATDTRTVTLDPAVPAITVTAPADNSATNSALITVTGNVKNPKTAVVVGLTGGEPAAAVMDGGNFSTAIAVKSGINTIEIAARDLAGKTATTKRTITYDPQAPALAITSPGSDLTANFASLTVRGTVSDTQTGVTITVGDQSFTPEIVDNAFTQAVTFPAEATYAIAATATGAAGNTTTVRRNVIYRRQPGGLLGDLNGDGTVDVADAVLALRVAVGIEGVTPALLARGDVAPFTDGRPAPDGVIDVADALLIIEKVVGLVEY